MAGAAPAHQAATATHEETSQQRAGRTRRTSANPQRAQQGATAAAAAAPAALGSLSRLQRLADASPQVAQLRRLQVLADGRFAPVAQLAGGPEEEELVQGKFATAQLQPQLQQAPHANNTGLPDQLKSGIESLSGLSMDHVRVHYNSAQPEQLNALAYAQGSDIHLAPGQEQHLPHEAWHVVQQAQGRVRPTMQMAGGVAVNDDAGLEREADVMGGRLMHAQTHRIPLLQAQSYAQGSDIHIASGQEKHLPHEAWHVVQQKQGRVKPTMQLKGKVNINDDAGLEKEADVMGAKAVEKGEISSLQLQKNSGGGQPLAQVIQKRALAANKMNVAGETHNESDDVRDEEKTYAEAITGGVYKQEGEFKTSKWALFGAERLGDPLMLRAEMLLAILREKTLVEILNPFGANQIPQRFVDAGIGHEGINTLWDIFRGKLQAQLAEIVTVLNLAIEERAERTQAARAINVHTALLALHDGMPHSVANDVRTHIIPEIQRIIGLYAAEVLQAGDIRAENAVSALRSEAMQEAAADNAAKIIGSQVGVWKVGENHIPQIAQDKQGNAYDLLTKAEFNAGFNDWRAKIARRSEGLEENWDRLNQIALTINQPEAQQIIEEKRIRTRMLDIKMLSNQGSFIQFNIEMLSLIQDLPQLVQERKERSGDLLIAYSGLNRPLLQTKSL